MLEKPLKVVKRTMRNPYGRKDRVKRNSRTKFTVELGKVAGKTIAGNLLWTIKETMNN